MKYKLISPTNPHFSVIQQVFENRGMNPNEVTRYFCPTEEDVFSPLLLQNMREGAQMFIRHVKNNDKAIIIVDSDCDGFTSSAIFLNYFNCLFPSYVQNNISYKFHSTKKHGIIEEEITDDIKLIIAPDCSSNEFELHEKLAQRGIDVLVLDHHEAPHLSQYACVINNQLCDYPNKALSGAGVVYKFCKYFDSLIDTNYADNYLDLVAVGCVSDMVNLQSVETHYLVTQGIENIKNLFLETMIVKNDFFIKGKLSPHKISFYIAPGVNATTRMGTDEEKQLLFEAMLDFKSSDLIFSNGRGQKNVLETKAVQACRNCTNIKQHQDNDKKKIFDDIVSKIDTKLFDNKILVAFIEEDYSNKGMAGLIANQMVGKYHRPVLVLSQRANDTFTGSARNYDASQAIKDYKSYIQNTNLANFAEGHQSAFGVSFTKDNLNKFIEKSNEDFKDYDFSACHMVDFIWEYNMLNRNDISTLADLEDIWGKGIEEPLVMIKQVPISAESISVWKNNALYINLSNMSMLKRKATEEEIKQLTSSGCVFINVIGTCTRDSFHGDIPEIEIIDYEIANQLEYYF